MLAHAILEAFLEADGCLAAALELLLHSRGNACDSVADASAASTVTVSERADVRTRRSMGLVPR